MINLSEVSPEHRKDILVPGSAKFNIQVGERIFEFQCEDEATALSWLSAIATHFD